MDILIGLAIVPYFVSYGLFMILAILVKQIDRIQYTISSLDPSPAQGLRRFAQRPYAQNAARLSRHAAASGVLIFYSSFFS